MLTRLHHRFFTIWDPFEQQDYKYSRILDIIMAAKTSFQDYSGFPGVES